MAVLLYLVQQELFQEVQAEVLLVFVLMVYLQVEEEEEEAQQL